MLHFLGHVLQLCAGPLASHLIQFLLLPGKDDDDYSILLAGIAKLILNICCS